MAETVSLTKSINGDYELIIGGYLAETFQFPRFEYVTNAVGVKLKVYNGRQPMKRFHKPSEWTINGVSGFATIKDVTDAITVLQGSNLNLPQWLKDKFLFIGYYSKIAAGKMPNEVGSDWLTVSGSAGSETYQCPNTAPYISADTDYVWFNQDSSQRTVLTADLIGYDLQRTPVKYADNTPYPIAMIGILKSGETFTSDQLNQLFYWFWLPIEWHNDTNAFGHVKGNRTGQNLWVPIVLYGPEMLTNGTFDTDTSWIHDGASIISAGIATTSGAIWSGFHQGIGEVGVAGIVYKLSGTVSGYSVGTYTFEIGHKGITYTITSNGDFEVLLTQKSGVDLNVFYFYKASTSNIYTCSIDNLSLKKVL